MSYGFLQVEVCSCFGMESKEGFEHMAGVERRKQW